MHLGQNNTNVSNDYYSGVNKFLIIVTSIQMGSS